VKHDSLVKLPEALIRGAAAGGAGTQARYAMGIDGGATKTLAAVLDLERGVLHLGHGGPSNRDAVGVRAATEALLEAAEAAIEGAGIGRDDLGAAVFAVAGTDTDAIVRQVHCGGSESWIVVNDVVGAWATATGALPGVGVISGTGSNVFGVGPGARAWRAGGWGHVLGDEGSGYWFGVQSIKAALRHRECSGPETALSEAALAFFEVSSVEALAARVYSKPLTKGEIAAFAAETARIANDGDAVARELYERGAKELGGQIAAVMHQTGLADRDGADSDGEEEAFPVGLIGSAFKAGAVFVEPLTRAIHEFAGKARVSVVEMAPVGGCVLLAAHACGARDAVDRAALAPLIDEMLAR
jgi:N-acetylglucosamine kinase-like BadF-type ATPase